MGTPPSHLIGRLGQIYLFAQQLVDPQMSAAANLSQRTLATIEEWHILPEGGAWDVTSVVATGYDSLEELADMLRLTDGTTGTFAERLRQTIAHRAWRPAPGHNLLWEVAVQQKTDAPPVVSVIYGTAEAMRRLKEEAESTTS